jgi:hypothetical protein
MLEAVPLLILQRVAKAVRARQVDDDVGVRRLEAGRRLVAQADEDDVGAGAQRLGVRHERRQVAVEARVEGRRALAGERVRPEGDRLEPWVREHAVQGLLPCISGAPENRNSRHSCIVCRLDESYAISTASALDLRAALPPCS